MVMTMVVAILSSHLFSAFWLSISSQISFLLASDHLAGGGWPDLPSAGRKAATTPRTGAKSSCTVVQLENGSHLSAIFKNKHLKTFRKCVQLSFRMGISHRTDFLVSTGQCFWVCWRVPSVARVLPSYPCTWHLHEISQIPVPKHFLCLARSWQWTTPLFLSGAIFRSHVHSCFTCQDCLVYHFPDKGQPFWVTKKDTATEMGGPCQVTVTRNASWGGRWSVSHRYRDGR